MGTLTSFELIWLDVKDGPVFFLKPITHRRQYDSNIVQGVCHMNLFISSHKSPPWQNVGTDKWKVDRFESGDKMSIFVSKTCDSLERLHLSFYAWSYILQNLVSLKHS